LNFSETKMKFAACLAVIGGITALVAPRFYEAGESEVEKSEPKVPEESLESLVQRLPHAGADAKSDIARTLGDRGTPKFALPILVDLLKDDDFGVRFTAAYAIGKAESSAHHESTALLRLIEREPEGVGCVYVLAAAYTALSRIKVNAPALHAQARIDMRDPALEIRMVAVVASVDCANGNMEIIVPSLVIMLEDPLADHRSFAANRLREYGKQASAAIPALRAMKDDIDEKVRKSARNALDSIVGADE
jgi:HEAT repeat protein